METCSGNNYILYLLVSIRMGKTSMRKEHIQVLISRIIQSLALIDERRESFHGPVHISIILHLAIRKVTYRSPLNCIIWERSLIS